MHQPKRSNSTKRKKIGSVSLVVDKRAKSNLCVKCSCGINVQVYCWVRTVIWNSIRPSSLRRTSLTQFLSSFFLVDETMAPLDPASKGQVMHKLKSFCKDSVVLVIYHTDAGRGPSPSDPTSDEDACVPGNSFFDYNLHVVDKHLVTRPVC